MIVDENVYSAYKITEFIEHHGTKGQKWGIRNPKKAEALRVSGKVVRAVGRGSWKATKAVGREAKAHPKAAVSIAAGAVFVAAFLIHKGKIRTSQAEHMKKLAQAGSAWRTANGPWNYPLPSHVSIRSPSSLPLFPILRGR